MPSPLFDPLRLLYVVLFGGAAVACMAGVWRATSTEAPDLRRSLVAFLGCSAAWAGAHVGYLLVTGAVLQYAFYAFGLVVGFATVWGWLWFCSAYAGRGFHRQAGAREFALVVVGVITVTKVTNPLHDLYFTVAETAVPFHHLAIDHHELYWISLGTSYALAGIGAFFLFESFVRVRAGTRPLIVLIGLTVLPALFNVVAYSTSQLPNITHEPLGVAIFAVGTLFFYEGRFRDVQLSGSEDEPALVVGADGRLRGYNKAAATLLPGLGGARHRGRLLTEVVPALAEGIGAGQGAIELYPEANGEMPRSYEVTESRFGGGGRRWAAFDSDGRDRTGAGTQGTQAEPPPALESAQSSPGSRVDHRGEPPGRPGPRGDLCQQGLRTDDRLPRGGDPREDSSDFAGAEN